MRSFHIRSFASRIAPVAAAATLALTACGPTPTPVPTASPTMPPPTAAPPTEAPLPTEVPLPTETPEPTPVASTSGINMAADPSLGVSAQPLLIPAVPKSDAPGFGGAAPEHWLFTFGDKTQTDLLAPLDPQLRIFPAGAYAAIDPTMAKVIEDLKALLAARPAEITGTIPVLPLIPAAQVLHAQPRYLDFQNGSGVSFVTAYAQDVSPILRDRTFYTFQGLTNDGQYYISLFYPVTTGVLPQTVEETPAAKDMDAFVKGFDQYLADTTALLSDPATAYEPDLVILDNLITSLNVAPPAPPAPPASAQVAPTPVLPAAPAAQSLTATTTAGVNVRSGPGTRNRIVATLRRGTEVEAVGRNEGANWIQVKLKGDALGWISATYLRSEAALDSLPVAP